MKKFSFSVFNIISVFLIVMFILFAVCPFNLIDMEQAQRIAKWKSEYEQLNYCFSLVEMHEGSIFHEDVSSENIDYENISEKIKPYFNFSDTEIFSDKKYKYRYKNGRAVPSHSQFYFDKFNRCKDGSLISFKKNSNYTALNNQPVYYMFVDINGEKKPNRIGQDIFFISIFKHNISAFGHDISHGMLKTNCSPIGSGVYCSEYYLLGGRF